MRTFIFLLLSAGIKVCAKEKLPIIDMHLHVNPASMNGPPPTAICMKKYILIILTVLLQTALYAQKKGQAKIDSLVQVLNTSSQDTTRINIYNLLANDFLQMGKADSALELSANALLVSQQINFTPGEADSYFLLGQIYTAKTNPTEALKNYEHARKLFEMNGQTVRVAETYYAMGVIHQRSNYDEALRMFKKSLNMAQQTNDKNLMGRAASIIANTYLRAGDYNEAPQYNDLGIRYYTESGNQTGLANCYVASARINNHRGNFQQSVKDNYAALRIYEQGGNKVGIYNVHTGLGLMYQDQENYKEALNSYRAAKKSAEQLGNKEVIANANINLGNTYRELGMTAEALKIFEETLKLAEQTGSKKIIASVHGNLGTIYSKMGRPTEALKSYEEAIKLFEQIGAKESLGIAYFEIGLVYFDMKKPDESKKWVEKALQVAKQVQYKEIISKSYLLLMQIDTSAGNYVSALQHHQLYVSYRDSLTNAEAARQLIEQRMQYAFSKKEDSLHLEQALIAEKLDKQTLLTKQQQQELLLKQSSLELARREKDLQQSQLDKQTLLSGQKEQALLLKEKELTVQRSQRNFYLAGAIALLLISFFIFGNYRNQRKANLRLQGQQRKTEQALKELKATQTQLIHSEKMASLGVLTAGIAHEIQNPLNFVNNFSELNNEMLDEMKLELRSGKLENALEIAESIKENNSKINHHGGRADEIVKGMLQHSRASSNKKEPTDINKLADEYLRLSYHGLRAKDKEFNAHLTSNFDKSIGKIEVVTQDIGSVLLNLYNNAFYAVNEKKKQQGLAFEPTVSVITKKLGDKVEISVIDNGNGIPQKSLDKIYQPFFTTKPTGQGTGLGLSISYDIIKAHGGELKVETKEGEFTEFKIQLPVGNNNVDFRPI